MTGQVLLIVNTASKCGFTPQYAGLEAGSRRPALHVIGNVSAYQPTQIGEDPEHRGHPFQRAPARIAARRRAGVAGFAAARRTAHRVHAVAHRRASPKRPVRATRRAGPWEPGSIRQRSADQVAAAMVADAEIEALIAPMRGLRRMAGDRAKQRHLLHSLGVDCPVATAAERGELAEHGVIVLQGEIGVPDFEDCRPRRRTARGRSILPRWRIAAGSG
jgi:hypothetical protein